MLTGPDGSPVVFISPAWSGERAAGDEILGRIAALGSPVVNMVTDTTVSAVMRTNDELFSSRGHYAIGTRNVAELTPAAIDALIEIARNRVSPGSAINWHHFHGTATRVPLADTAFGVRRDHLMIELIGVWSDGEASVNLDWIRDGTDALAPHALPGGYPNLLGPDRHDQIAQAYGPNTPRLLAAKARYDPTDTFTSIPLPAPATRMT